MKNSKATIYDVAEYLGVSTSTVNRVLNNKPHVSEKMKNQVMEAVEKLGYRPSKTAASLNRQPIHVVVIMPVFVKEFVAQIKIGVESALASYEDFNFHGKIVEYDPSCTQKQYIDILYKQAEEAVDAILLVTPPVSSVICRAIDDIAKSGIKFGVALAEINVAANLFNLQINGITAGNMAAELLSFALAPGEKVAMVTGFFDHPEHKATIEGFTTQIKKGSLEFCGVYEHNDDPELAEWVAEKIVKDIPDIKGIYIGTAISVPFCKRLEELGFAGAVKIIASDIFPAISDLMDRGIVHGVIFKSPREFGKKLVKTMYEHLVEGYVLEEKNEYLEPIILLNSNKKKYMS